MLFEQLFEGLFVRRLEYREQGLDSGARMFSRCISGCASQFVQNGGAFGALGRSGHTRDIVTCAHAGEPQVKDEEQAKTGENSARRRL
jgi:hypothetical protein